MTDFKLDRSLVEAFVAGTLDPQGEAELAAQVARVIPFHAMAPNPVAAGLSRIIHHLGDERALLAWLDRHPGEPRLVARLFVLIGLLDRYGDEPAVVTALRALAAIAMLQQIAPRARELDPKLDDLPDLLEQVRQDILAAAGEQSTRR